MHCDSAMEGKGVSAVLEPRSSHGRQADGVNKVVKEMSFDDAVREHQELLGAQSAKMVESPKDFWHRDTGGQCWMRRLGGQRHSRPN